MKNKIFLSFYGATVLIETESDEIAGAVKHNFSYFHNNNPLPNTDIKITCHNQNLPCSSLPAMMSTAATPRNICYKHNGKTYLDYFGKAISICDIRKNIFDIYTTDNNLAGEIIYLTILARISELLDKKGMHRIHSVGLAYNTKGVLILMPCGGGKTSLTLSLINQNDNGILLISEDSPLIKKGMALPFPLRIGVREETVISNNIPADFLRKTNPLEYSSKTTIDIEYFSKSLCKNPVPIKAIFVGIRSTAADSSIKSISKLGVLKHCVMNSIIGVGLYQGMEFIMQNNSKEILRHLVTLFSRAIANINIILRAKTFRFVIGSDQSKNAEVFRKFLDGLN